MRPLAGVTLASLSVIQALDLHHLRGVVFSTDSNEYAESVLRDVERLGRSTERLTIHYRDSNAAGSQSKIFDVLQRLNSETFFESGFVALMLPTAPLRRRSTAEFILNRAETQGQTSFTACPYDFHVSFAFTSSNEGGPVDGWKPLLEHNPMLTGVTRSQDQVNYLHPHGGFALIDTRKLPDQATLYEGSAAVQTTRIEGLDIDVSEDLSLVRCLEGSLAQNFPFLPEAETGA